MISSSTIARLVPLCLIVAAALPTAAIADEPQSALHPERIEPPVHYAQLRPHWLAAPMVEREIYSADPTAYADKEDILFQRAMLNSPDEALRSHATGELARCNNRVARGLLIDAVGKETAPHVRADMLSALLTLQADNVADIARADLTHADYRVRLMAARLYVAQPGVDLKPLVAQAKAETAPGVHRAMWQLLAGHPGAVAIADWQALQARPAPYPWLAAQALASHPQGPGTVKLKPLAESKDPAVRQMVALHLSADWSAQQAMAIFAPLSKDPHTAVRASVADSILRLRTDGALPTLVALSRDTDLTVRMTATQALAYYGERDAFDALVARLNDPESRRIRQAAEDSLVALQERFDVVAALPVTFTHAATETRYHGYRLARRLDTPQYGAQLTDRIAAELGDARLESTLIETLGLIDYKPAGDPIIAQATHESPEVRAAAALAMGRLGRVDQQQLLIDFVRAEPDDEETIVRHAALEAMGYLPTGAFEDTLVWVLTQTKMENNPITGTHRAVAMWSLGRLDNLGDAAQKRMHTQMVRAVIPTPMGPVFEDDAVRVSAAWAAVEQYKRTKTPEMKAFAEKLIDVLNLPDPDGEASGPTIPTGENLREFGYQAEQYRDDAPTVPHEVSPVGYSFNYRKANNTTY